MGSEAIVKDCTKRKEGSKKSKIERYMIVECFQNIVN